MSSPESAHDKLTAQVGHGNGCRARPRHERRSDAWAREHANGHDRGIRQYRIKYSDVAKHRQSCVVRAVWPADVHTAAVRLLGTSPQAFQLRGTRRRAGCIRFQAALVLLDVRLALLLQRVHQLRAAHRAERAAVSDQIGRTVRAIVIQRTASRHMLSARPCARRRWRSSLSGADPRRRHTGRALQQGGCQGERWHASRARLGWNSARHLLSSAPQLDP